MTERINPECFHISIQENKKILEILHSCPLNSFSAFPKEFEKIPIRLFYLEGKNLLTSLLKKQIVTIIEREDVLFTIVQCEDSLRIQRSISLEDSILDIVFHFSKDEFEISHYVHDLSLSTKETKWYPCKLKMIPAFVLERKKVIDYLTILRKEIVKLPELANYITTDKVEKILSLF